MQKCPQCDYDAIFVIDASFCVEFDGTQQFYPRKIPAFCNDTQCDQRYWYYPLSGKITKRNTGAFSPFLNRRSNAHTSV